MAHLGLYRLLCVSLEGVYPRCSKYTNDSFSCMIICSYPSSYMSLWLKEEGYSVTQINQLPTVTYAVNIVASWLGTTLAAIYPEWIIYTIASACCLFSTLCMIIWNIPTALK
jgi:hypothetical protein